jgi:hypothetical protein
LVGREERASGLLVAFGSSIQHSIQVLVDSRLSSAEAHAFVGTICRQKLADVESQGYGKSFAHTVDGVLGAAEETARLDGGEVRYFFTSLTEAVTFALAFLHGASPRGKTGKFEQAWFIIVNNQPWVGAIKDIPRGSLVMISNYAPYARHLETGWKNRRAGRHMTEKARSAVKRQFPGITVQSLFITIPFRPGSNVGGWAVPYISRRGPIAYPALSISEG